MEPERDPLDEVAPLDEVDPLTEEGIHEDRRDASEGLLEAK